MEKIYDFAGIGIGPFNLGLAALASSIQPLDTIFFDQKPDFNWHPGLMLDNAALQVAFYADLVTLAEPTSRFSFLAYLKAKGRLFPFGILENNYITRKEYVRYCRWVVGQLPNLCFGYKVEAVHFSNVLKCYKVLVSRTNKRGQQVYYARKLVLGVGSVARVPDNAKNFLGEKVFHSGEYLDHRDKLFQCKSVAIVGSGQSAAEIVSDLLPYTCEFTNGLFWITRSERFYPMDYSKLTLEMSTPDYINYFYSLPAVRKEAILDRQKALYKGINYGLIEKIYAQLYELGLEDANTKIHLWTNCELKRVEKSAGYFRMNFFHRELGRRFACETEAVILATGYGYMIPDFIEPVRKRIVWKDALHYGVALNYSIDKKGSEIFVQNAELHTHGFNAPDLSLGPYRNAVILKEMTGYDFEVTGRKNTFQDFGIPPDV